MDHDVLSLNLETVHQLDLPAAVDACVAGGIGAVGVWRHRVDEIGVARARALLDGAGLRVSSVCRGGFFTSAGAERDNLAAIEQTAELGADLLVLVSGGLPAGSRDLAGARQRVVDGIAAMVRPAERLGVRLAVEPLHPMFCADRCVVNSLGQAVDIASRFPADVVGVVVDSYHVWWDPNVLADIRRAGPRIFGYQLSDWCVPLPDDTLLGRGHIGDGVIDFAPLTDAVRAAGYSGDVEVEIFNADVWATPAAETIATVRERFAALQ